MKSSFFKSSTLVVACSLATSNVYSKPATANMQPANAQHANMQQNAPQQGLSEKELLENWIRDTLIKFEQLIGLFKEQLKGISPQSKEKLAVTCKKIKVLSDQMVKEFIDPTHAEVQRLKGTSLEHSNYYALLHVLLDVSAELRKHFDLIYNTLNKSLQGNPTAISVAKNLKPIIDTIISDANFEKLDNLLTKAHACALSYNIVIEIKSQYRTIIDIENENQNKTYHIKLPEMFALIRKSLRELQNECRKPAAISQAEMLRLIRSRL